ncbi:MAG: hypothetical protein HZA91_17570 [Verrucomicrobia bacterium]|nr:hypothetical protein [Verrucomicrobiota bacterium]
MTNLAPKARAEETNRIRRFPGRLAIGCWLLVMALSIDLCPLNSAAHAADAPKSSDRTKTADAIQAEVLAKIRKFVPPLSRSRGDRLPILVWQSPDFPTGLATNAVEQTQQVWLDRGLLPLCNPCASAEAAKAYLPVFRYWQQRGFPVCILPQGWLQTMFTPDKNGRSKCRHEPPADPSPAFPCPAATLAAPRAAAHAENVTRTLELLKDNGVRVKLVVVDFESGLYLRNTGDREEKVREQSAMALRCPKCVAQFGRETLTELSGFVALADRARAHATQTALCDPARRVFPDLAIGNFYAWPINRLPRPEGRRPAYGFENSGMNVAMPRVYMNAGWLGAGRDQAKMNWNAFYCCLEQFSPAASVRRPGEMLIPWPHVWLGGRYLRLTMQRRALPEPWVMAEMARHMMLRGAETFAIWSGGLTGEYPPDYPYPQYAAMGQLVYDVAGIQEGYHDMLRFHDFLRQAKPMTFAVPGAPAELTAETATWSGMQTSDKALVRTIAFHEGKTLTRPVQVYGKTVTLSFGPRGRSFWVRPDGSVEDIAP